MLRSLVGSEMCIRDSRTRFYELRFPLGNRILLATAPLVALPIDWYG